MYYILGEEGATADLTTGSKYFSVRLITAAAAAARGSGSGSVASPPGVLKTLNHSLPLRLAFG